MKSKIENRWFDYVIAFFATIWIIIKHKGNVYKAREESIIKLKLIRRKWLDLKLGK